MTNERIETSVVATIYACAYLNESKNYYFYLFIYLAKESELAFVHLFDLQICFVGVLPTRQDLNDNVNLLTLYRVPLESCVHLQY